MRSGLVQIARGLRRSETAAEQKLWAELRNRQVDGWKFKRQVPFGNYVIDFFCYDARLAVEVDGATHSTIQEIAKDAERTAFLTENGVQILRCTNSEIEENLDGVLEMIYLRLGQQPAPLPALRAGISANGEASARPEPAPSPQPSPQGERETRADRRSLKGSGEAGAH